MRAVRAGLVVLALAACAWYALAIRADRDIAAVMATVDHAGAISTAQAAAADAKLDAAGILDPDQEVQLLRAQVALHAGRPARAVALARRAVAREPDNAVDWLVLEVVAFRIDPALTRLAQAEFHRLVPAVRGAP